MAFFEIRQYQVKSGMMDAWVALMEQDIIPYVTSKGMIVAGSFRGEDDPSVYIWIRRFENEEMRVAQYAAVYESPEWVDELSDRVGAMINREASVIQRVVATPASPVT